MPRETIAVLITLIVYKLVLVGIGLVAQRRTRDATDYFLAGRRMGPIVAAISASASSSSAWTLLGVSGFAYTLGLSALWLIPACVGGFILNWTVVAPRLRRWAHEHDALTTTDVIAASAQDRARVAIRWMAALIILGALATYVASQFQGAGKTLAETFDLSMTASILIGAAVVVFYTLLGGFWAASFTDTLQGLVMAAASIVLPIMALLAVGASELPAALRAVEADGYLDLFRGMAPAAGIGMAIGLLGIGLGYPGQPHVVNRFMALRSGEREMRTARTVAIAWAIVVYSGMILLGLCARAGLAETDDGERVLMIVANGVLHPVVAGVMIAAVLSAVMSTADSQLLVAASAVTHDLGLARSHRTMLLLSRLVVLALSAAAVAAALLVDDTIFGRVLFAWSAMGCAFGPLILVTLLRGPVAPAPTIASMVIGCGGAVFVYFWKQASPIGAWDGALERVAPFAAALAIAWCGARRPGPASP